MEIWKKSLFSLINTGAVVKFKAEYIRCFWALTRLWDPGIGFQSRHLQNIGDETTKDETLEGDDWDV